MRIDVGIGEFKASRNAGDTLKTYGLGSCIALIIHSKQFGAGGLIHVALPDSSANPAKARTLPCYFADTGIPKVLQYIDCFGARKAFSYRVFGGASILDDNGHFDIGKRNLLTIKRMLWKAGYGIIHEDVGGTVSRTVALDIASGSVAVNYVETNKRKQGVQRA